MFQYLQKLLSAASPAIAILTLGACQSMSPAQNSPAAIYALHLMTNQPDQLANLLETVANGKRAVIKIYKGRPIPLKIVLTSPIGKMDDNQNEIQLILNQDIYISLSQKETLISTDSQHWKNIKDLQALKQLLDFRSANISFSLAQQTGKSVSLVTTLETEPY